MQIKVFNKTSVASYHPKRNLFRKPLLIRIMDDSGWTNYPEMPNIHKYKAVHVMNFLDVEVDINDIERQELYGKDLLTDDDIEELIKFLEVFLDRSISEIVIHCDEGRRRSVSVALFIASRFLKDKLLVSFIEENYGKPYNNPRGNPMITKQLEDYYDNHYKKK